MPAPPADGIWDALRKTSLVGAFVACIASTSVAVATASAQVPLDDQRRDRVEAAITAFMLRSEAPGLSIAVVEDEAIVFEKGYGFADLENFAPAIAATVYPTASLAKPITAVAVMQLAENGKIDLDAPIQRYVPGFPQKTSTITVRDLLRHTGGVRQQKPDDFDGRHCDTLSDALGAFAADPLEHRPGERFRYSNHGYILLGLAVERVSGMRFVDYVRASVFEAAGMRHTRADDPHAIIPNRADGYAKTKAGELRKVDWVDTSCWIPRADSSRRSATWRASYARWRTASF